MKTSTKLLLSSVIAAAVLIGCGSGSASDVSGSVEASKLEGVKVCVKGTDNCAITDANGKFTLAPTPLPVQLEVKVGDSIIGSASVTSITPTITPTVLADGNSTVAAYIGALLHKAANCSYNDENCSLKNVRKLDIDKNQNLPIVDELKEKLAASATVKVKVNGVEINLTSTDKDLYQTANPTMSGATPTFRGALTRGDFAEFKFDTDTNKVTYKVTGNLYNISDTKELKNVYNNVFFTDRDNNFYFFSGTLGVSYINYNNNQLSLIGLQVPAQEIAPSMLKEFVNKRYNYMENDGTRLSFEFIDINSSDVNSLRGTWRKGDGNSGTWEVNGSHLDVYQNGSKAANIVLRPGISRNSIIVDLVSGGYGIGVEAKALTNEDMTGTYYYMNLESTGGVCYGKVRVNGTQMSHQDEKCYNSTTLSESFGLILNPNGMNGLAQVLDSNGNPTQEYVFLDPEDGFFIRVGSNGLSIGSSKPLK